ncbi:MAG TPA: glycogen synthase GlgA [Bryobacteraceae bacterium]|nr:glycogen synthase GlgA [Bryobacteraceae bacterium]
MAQLPRILMVSPEVSPWAKTGGLADVVGALPAALARAGHAVATVVPRYHDARSAPAKRVIERLNIPLGKFGYDVAIYELRAGDTSIYFVDQPSLFDRAGLYSDARGDFPDNHLRFAVFAKAALEVSRRLFGADIIHCHDWQASLAPVYLKDPRIADPHFLGVPTLLTIHNLGYQGVFDRTAFDDLHLPPEFNSVDGMEFFGRINFLKTGILWADRLNTVSPKYAEEIQTPEFGFALDGLLQDRRDSLSGILNGVDYGQWNPETDPLVPAKYSATDLSGKRICKAALLREMGLPEKAIDRPLLGVISRFTAQKGFDLIAEAARDLFSGDVYLVALGSGEAKWEAIFRDLQAEFPERVAVRFGYDDRLAHSIEAGADIFLMPSRYEPCGLNQIYSLRYGTVPVVRATGGLDDTITAFPASTATGFKFVDYNGEALLDAVRQACALWENDTAWRQMMVRGMKKDFSWTASANQYSTLYAELASSASLVPSIASFGV